MKKAILIKGYSINFGTRNSEKHENLLCGKYDGKRQKRPLPNLVFVRAQKCKSREKGNINKWQILKIAK